METEDGSVVSGRTGEFPSLEEGPLMVVQLLLVPARLHKGMGPAHVDSFNLLRPVLSLLSMASCAPGVEG